jgi:outer membrane protein assembly factor BamD (BamD/ComL family)
MINSLKIFSIFILLLLLASCVSMPKRTEKTGVKYNALPALSNEKLDQKMEAINNILKDNNISDYQKKSAISLLQSYEKIKDLNKGNSTREDYIKSIQILYNSLGIIEQRYLFSDGSLDHVVEQKIINDFSSLKKQIFDEYLADNHNEVISKCKELESRYGKKGLTPDIGLILVDSLSKSSKSKEALDTAKRIYNEMDSRPDMVNLLSDIIDLEIKIGNTKETTFFFEKLVDHINDKNNTYKDVENIIAKTKETDSTLNASIEKKISDINPEKANHAEQTLNNVKKLLSQNDYAGARLILLRWRLSAEEGPELDMIEDALKSVDDAEGKYNNSNSKDYKIIEDAKKMLEGENYEEAIRILEPLTTEGSDFEAEKLKNLAIDKHINNERLKAAKLFMAASEEKNIQKKKELLLSSKAILEKLINTYPETPLMEKLNSYITKINKELDQI